MFCLSIHQLLDICFQVLAVMNNVAMNICVQEFALKCFHFFEYIIRSGIAQAYRISMNNPMRNTKVFWKAASPFYISILPFIQ